MFERLAIGRGQLGVHALGRPRQQRHPLARQARQDHAHRRHRQLPRPPPRRNGDARRHQRRCRLARRRRAVAAARRRRSTRTGRSTLPSTPAAYVKGQPFRFGVNVRSRRQLGLCLQLRRRPTRTAWPRASCRSSPPQRRGRQGRCRGPAPAAGLHRQGRRATSTRSTSPTSRCRSLIRASNGAIATGSAALRFGRHIDAKLDLAASMLDLDELAGAKSRDVLRQAGSLAVIDSLLALLPDDMSLDGKRQGHRAEERRPDLRQCRTGHRRRA